MVVKQSGLLCSVDVRQRMPCPRIFLSLHICSKAFMFSTAVILQQMIIHGAASEGAQTVQP